MKTVRDFKREAIREHKFIARAILMDGYGSIEAGTKVIIRPEWVRDDRDYVTVELYETGRKISVDLESLRFKESF